MADQLPGLFKSRTPLRGRFPKERSSLASTDLLQFYRGDTIRLDIQVFDETSTPQSLVGATIRSFWKEEECYTVTVYELAIGTGITVLDASKGIIRVELSPAQSANLLTITYVFDVEVTLEDGTVGTVLKKWVEILPDISEDYPPPEL